MRVHHIGYLVKKIDKALPQFEGLGFVSEGEIVYDEIRDIDILFMINGDYRIELVSPKSEKSVTWDLLKKMGASPYHLCYYSSNIEADISKLRESGYIPAGEPLPAPAFNNRRVVFLYSRHAGMIELVEE
ncbi:MAG: VOC family protein [Lachnospiraceae bacterium]|nr:VOC family protein [Lachnospiraceae bacterium]